MTIPLPTELTALARIFRDAGFPLYAVGGMVRNACLGLPVQDIDVTSPMPVSEARALLEARGVACREKGAFFGTLDIGLGEHTFEYASFRAEEYGAGGAHRPGAVRFGATLEEDAFRRDFTINALYYDILGQRLIDPTGGLADLKAHIIRATSPDPNVILRDDGLRVLRMARFAAELGFSVEPGTLAAARANAAGVLDISAERVREELDKLLLADIRYGLGRERVLYGLSTLAETEALAAVLPEIAAGAGIAQRPEYHAYDVQEHMLRACACAKPERIARLAALLHDVGKPVAFRETGRMLGHDAIGANISREMLARLKYPNAVKEEVTGLIRWHMFDLNGNAKESTLRRRFAGWGAAFTLALADLREADVHGSGRISGEVKSALRWRAVLARMQTEGAPLSEAELCCTGADIMEWLNLPPSPRVGEIKRMLLLHCACHPKDNCRARLGQVAKDIGK
ncbi:MAG: HD domain-containing protein [Christensenellaceae bacterium]|nr:HD domain-containing protein [Christensenellaceae bacterium]